MRRLMTWTMIGAASLAMSAGVEAAEKLKVLIVEGQNNHSWETTTPILKNELERTGRFEAAVVTTPPARATASEWEGFRPDFKKFDVVLTNYNGDPWPAPVREALEEYVADGGGLVVMHAANNAFPEWPEYNDMIGLGWRGPDFGDRITVDDSGNVVRTPKDEGPGAGHGRRHAFTIDVRDPNHPITKGLPPSWAHTVDELYHGQRGPAKNMVVLATAFSDEATGGTGAHEPMLWTVAFGKGRVAVNVLGHTQGEDVAAIEAPDFRALTVRTAEWAATGAVTIPVPADFPTATK